MHTSENNTEDCNNFYKKWIEKFRQVYSKAHNAIQHGFPIIFTTRSEQKDISKAICTEEAEIISIFTLMTIFKNSESTDVNGLLN